MTAADWADPNARSLCLYLDGADDPDRAADGSLLVDDDFLFLVNAVVGTSRVRHSPTRPGQMWYREIDSFDPTASSTPGLWTPDGTVVCSAPVRRCASRSRSAAARLGRPSRRAPLADDLVE